MTGLLKLLCVTGIIAQPWHFVVTLLKPQKYTPIFVCRHYLFWVANTFLRARKTVSFEEQLCLRTNIWAYFHAKWRLLCLWSFKYFWQHGQFWKLGNIAQIFPRFSCHVTLLDQSHVSKNIWLIIVNTIFTLIAENSERASKQSMHFAYHLSFRSMSFTVFTSK